MSRINQATILGNLGRDPEINHTNDGNAVARLSIATSERWTDKHTGEKRERTEWHRVVVFGPLADVVSQYAVKGDKIFVQGKLSTRKWTDRDGVERYTTEIVLNQWNSQLELLGARNSSTEDRAPRQDNQGNQGNQGTQHQQDNLDDEIPF